MGDMFKSDPKAHPDQAAAQQLASLAMFYPNYQALLTQNLPGLINQFTNQARIAERGVDDAVVEQANRLLPQLSSIDRTVRAQDIASQKVTNPEYFASREKAAGGLDALFKSILSPTGTMDASLSEAEREELTRGVNRTNIANGNFNNPSATNTAANAMVFGQAANNRLMQKQGAMTSALAQVPGLLGSFQVQPTNNFMQGFNYAGLKSGFGENNAMNRSFDTFNQYSQNLFDLGKQQQEIDANRRGGVEKTVSSMPDY